MKKLLAKFGYVPRLEMVELRERLAGSVAVNAELRERANHLEHELRQVISQRERHKLAHDTLKDEHEKQARCSAKLAQTLSTQVPVTILGLRK